MVRLVFWLCVVMGFALLMLGESSSSAIQPDAMTTTVSSKSEAQSTTPVSPATLNASPVTVSAPSPRTVTIRQETAKPRTEGVKKTLVTFSPAETPAQIYVSKRDAPAGYVNRRAVAEHPPVPTSAEQVIVTGSRVNLRRGPSTGNPVVAALTQGTRAEVLSRAANGWVELRAESGHHGFMSAKFLTAAK